MSTAKVAAQALIDRTAGATPLGQGTLSAVEELVEGIRSYIDTERLYVGDNLPSERELCERFNTSRNTVREAMRMLKAYGVVDVRPKVGAIITDNRMERVFDLFSFNTLEISRDTFSEIQGFRGLLEVGSVDVIFENVLDEDLVYLRELNQSLAQAKSIAEASEFDFRFHTRIISILRNRAVLDIYRLMKPVIIRIMEKGKSRRDFSTDTFAQHAEIIDALEARDRIKYQYKLQHHLQLGYSTFSEGGRTSGAGG